MHFFKKYKLDSLLTYIHRHIFWIYLKSYKDIYIYIKRKKKRKSVNLKKNGITIVKGIWEEGSWRKRLVVFMLHDLT